MKIAVSGKGGSGKTTVSGTLARAFATEGHDVLAIDDDDNPNLALTLGVPNEVDSPPLPGGLVTGNKTPEGEIELGLASPPEKIIEDHSTAAPNGVKLLKVGKVEAGSGCFCGAHATAHHLMSSLEEGRQETTIMDMVAGLEHLSLGTAEAVDVMFVVVEPYYRSLETGRKTKDLAMELNIPDVRVIANKVRDDHDLTAIEDYCNEHDLEIAAIVPFDDAIRYADQEGIAPIDYDANSEAVLAIRKLADTLGAL